MPAEDLFKSSQRGLTSPASHAFAVTPSDTVDMTLVSRALYVGGAGDVRATLISGGTVTFRAVAAGAILPVCASRVLATATTATHILALV